MKILRVSEVEKVSITPTVQRLWDDRDLVVSLVGCGF